VGADENQPYWAPRNNTFIGNDGPLIVITQMQGKKFGSFALTTSTLTSKCNAGPPARMPGLQRGVCALALALVAVGCGRESESSPAWECTRLTEPPGPPPMLVSAFGMQLHAAVTVDVRDRKRLERVCRSWPRSRASASSSPVQQSCASRRPAVATHLRVVTLSLFDRLPTSGSKCQLVEPLGLLEPAQSFGRGEP
jgi:hypothetical protein